MRRLVAHARAERAAARLGTDVAEVVGRRAELLATDRGITRRTLLRRAAVAGAGASLAARIAADPQQALAGAHLARRPASQPSIAIIGAGISGMTAAMTLHDAGFTGVTVYEAGDRIGGRTYTRKGDGFWDAGQWSEWGGELVDTGHELMHALCRRFGFGLIDLADASGEDAGATDVLWFGGRYYGWQEMSRDWQAAQLERTLAADLAALPEFPWAFDDAAWTPKGRALDRMTVREWIDSRVPGGSRSRLGAYLDVAYNVEYGEDTTRQGATDLLCLLGYQPEGSWWIYGESDERWKIVGGNQQIALAQAELIGRERVRHGWTLEAVTPRPGGGVVLRFDVAGAKRLVEADRAILAVPIGPLKRIAASGGLDRLLAGDARKRGFIDAIGLGANSKLQLQLRDRRFAGSGPWGRSSGESYSDTGFQQIWHVTEGQPGRTAILNNYTGGDTARAFKTPVAFADTADARPAVRRAVEQAARAFLRQAEPVFPGLSAAWTGKATLSAWHLGPNHHGAYSYWTPGYVQRFSTVERRATGAVHWAGEHTSSDFQGYMEGGAVEGQRAAQEIVRLYTRT